MLKYLLDNKQWIFSGIGLTVLGGLVLAGRWAVKKIHFHLQAKHWKGIEFNGCYFSWEGPNLHTLVEKPATTTPDGLPNALRNIGVEPRFGIKANLPRHFASGYLLVFETDKRSWKKEMIYKADPSQVLIVKPK